MKAEAKYRRVCKACNGTGRSPLKLWPHCWVCNDQQKLFEDVEILSGKVLSGKYVSATLTRSGKETPGILNIETGEFTDEDGGSYFLKVAGGKD